MTYGVKILSDSGVDLFAGKHIPPHCIEKIPVTIVANVDTDVISTVDSTSPPPMFFASAGHVGNIMTQNGKWGISIVSPPDAESITVYVFTTQHSAPTSGDYGIAIYNEDGDLSFNFNNKYMKAKQTVTTTELANSDTTKVSMSGITSPIFDLTYLSAVVTNVGPGKLVLAIVPYLYEDGLGTRAIMIGMNWTMGAVYNDVGLLVLDGADY